MQQLASSMNCISFFLGGSHTAQKGDKYERGKEVLEVLAGQKLSRPTSGFGAFSPEIVTSVGKDQAENGRSILKGILKFRELFK